MFINYLLQSQPTHTSVVEYGGGYYYPDPVCKSEDPMGETILRQYAAMINGQMKKTGTKVFGFICRNIASEEAIKAYRIYAEEIEDLTGMIAVQYSPYNGGLGKTIWVKNKKRRADTGDSSQVPVVDTSFPKPGSGDPQQLAGWINEDE